MLFTFSLHVKFEDQCYCNLNLQHKFFYNTDSYINIVLTSIKVNNHDIEFIATRAAQKVKNKVKHTENGNSKEKKKKKTNKKLYIIQVNKGHSNLPKHLELIKKLINDENPSVMIMPESQIRMDEPLLQKAFENYNAEHKFRIGHDKTRISMFIKNTIEYERLPDIENPEDSNIWVKIKTGTKTGLVLMGGYREWRIPGQPDSSM